MSGEELANLLVRHRIIDPSAVEDPEGYDGYTTLDRVNAAARELREERDNEAIPPEEPEPEIEPISFHVTIGELYWSKSFGGTQWELIDDDCGGLICLQHGDFHWVGTIEEAAEEFYRNKI